MCHHIKIWSKFGGDRRILARGGKIPTGTVETSDLSDSDVNSSGEEYEKYFTITTIKEEEMRGIEDEILEVHG